MKALITFTLIILPKLEDKTLNIAMKEMVSEQLIQVADNLKNSKKQIPNPNFNLFQSNFTGIWYLEFGICSS